MNSTLDSTRSSKWFEQIPENDGPLVLADGKTVSVLRHELRYLMERKTGNTEPATPDDCQKVGANVIGLAFSGGGIRSATFGLGVLEGLKELSLLKQFDFLSTVSGGGYLGGWFSANCLRGPARPPDTTVAMGPTDWLDSAADWSGSIAYLRRYSNYLSPKLGFASADTWSMLTIWVRNALLVQFTIILAIAAVLLVPRLLMPAFEHWYTAGDWRWTSIALYLLAVVGIAANQRRLLAGKDEPMLDLRYWRVGLFASALLFGAAWGWAKFRGFEPFSNQPIAIVTTVVLSVLLLMATYCLLPVGVKIVNLYGTLRKATDPAGRLNYTQFWVQALVVLPMIVAALLVAAVLWGQALDPNNKLSTLKTFGALFKEAWWYWPLPLVIAFVSFVLLSLSALRNMKRPLAWIVLVLAPSVAVIALHALLCVIMLIVHYWTGETHENAWKAFVWVPSLLLYAFSIAIVVLLGILGRETTEAVREWWSRLGAWLAIYAAAWMLVAVVAVYGPLWGAMMFSSDSWHGPSISLGWVLTTAAGLLAGNSSHTSGAAAKSKVAQAREWFAHIAPYVYIAGLLVAVSTCLHLIIILNSPNDVTLRASSLADHHWTYLASSPWSTTGWVVLATLALLALFAWRVDINEFSLNSFYRSRLVRCYLGATRVPTERHPQNFTGFDENDDLPISTLRDSTGPLHIVNCALNLGGSSDLALHTRHSASFTITPLSIGSFYRSGDPGKKAPIGFRETSHYGGAHGLTSVGKAISVSGAAASPNMGYHSSPIVAFVMTMFNARLGWWFARPRDNAQIKSSSPAFSLRYLLAELFASADDRSNFVMVSDGGHFENLGVYELVRRRCRVIIASDAECDPGMRFEGLGTLKRMCEVDFGVTINIDVSSLLRDPKTGWSKSRCAVGKIIYDAMDSSKDGIFIYLKASMNGHEDEAILEYKAIHPAFPHESTGNQFYGEDQFESYRKLGREISVRTFYPVAEIKNPDAPPNARREYAVGDLAGVAERLVSIWTPSLTTSERFAEQSDGLMRVWNQLGYGKEVRLFDAAQEKLLADKWPDEASSDTFRTAFYVSSQIIQLMENVYMNLDLEDTWHHPDNVGWQGQFNIWAGSPAIRRTWELTSQTFGRRFQYFCNRHLGLPLGQPQGSNQRGFPPSK